jgi:hypothetical protein
MWYLNNSQIYWSDWNAAGYDIHGLDGVNPQFTNGSGTLSLPLDFTLQPTSPAICTGNDVGLTTNFGGNPIQGKPDIGAY